MTRLNSEFNSEEGQLRLKQVSGVRNIPTPRQLDRVISLARRIPELGDVWDELELVKKDYQRVLRLFTDDSELIYLFGLLQQWHDFETLVLQRHAGLYNAELRAADRVARDIFQHFYGSPLLDPENRSYSHDARPLAFVGATGPDAYFTWPPSTKRPLGIINLPEGSVNNVWGWLALGHEVGHDIYASIAGLREEVETSLADAMHVASADGRLSFGDVNFRDGDSEIVVAGTEFAALLWKQWANEAQADIIGLLQCGGAAAMTLQGIIGYEAEDIVERDFFASGTPNLLPEVHPTSYIRNVLNIRALDRLGFGDFAAELQTRFEALRPTATKVQWKLPFSDTVVAEQDIAQLERSVDVALDVLLDGKLDSLNEHSYRDVINFTADDQAKVDAIADAILAGDPEFDREASPRHALAGTVIALEKDPARAALIHETFIHFLSPPR